MMCRQYLLNLNLVKMFGLKPCFFPLFILVYRQACLSNTACGYTVMIIKGNIGILYFIYIRHGHERDTAIFRKLSGHQRC